MFKNFSKQQKIIAIALGLIFIVAIIYSLSILIYRHGKIAVVTKYAPFTASVKVNGEAIKNDAVNYLVPGEYKVEVSLEHFDSAQSTVEISENKKHIIGSLNASDSEGESITDGRQADFLEVEGIFGDLAVQANAARRAANPILKYLPINKVLYSISYQGQDDGSFRVIIKSNYTYQDVAVARLYELPEEVVPSEYYIKFGDDYYDPFYSELVASDANNGSIFVEESFADFLDDFDIVSPTRLGDYFIAALRRKGGEATGFYETYRVVLHRENNSWKLLAKPYPIMSQYNAAGVPIDVLEKVNQL